MKFLFIVTELRSANGICVNAIMQKLSDLGHSVICISNKEYGECRYYQRNNIEYYKVSPRLIYSISSRVTKSNDGKLLKRMLSIIGYIVNKIQLFLSIPTWPVISPTYSRRIYSRANELYDKYSYDVIVPVYTQIDTLIAAKKIKKLHPQVNLIPYFLDSLAGGYGPKIFSKEWVQKRGLKWEAKLLSTADKIIMMQSSRSFYEKLSMQLTYWSRITFLDIPLFKPVSISEQAREIDNTGIKHIVYVGSIPSHIRNPLFFLRVFTSLKRDDVDLTIIGPSTCESMLNHYCTIDKRIKRIQRVSHEEALDRIRKANFLLNLGNNIATMMPSKIFEYMSTGKPIISTAPIKNEPCIPYLSKYEYSLILDEQGDLKEEITKLDIFLTKAKSTDALKLNNIFYLNTAEAFVDAIKQC